MLDIVPTIKLACFEEYGINILVHSLPATRLY